MKFASIQIKIALFSGLCVLITSAVIIGFASMILVKDREFVRQKEIREARNQIAAIAGSNAMDIGKELECALMTARVAGQMLSGATDKESAGYLNRLGVNHVLKTLLSRNPHYIGMFTLWNPDALGAQDVHYKGVEGHDANGRFTPYVVKDARGRISLVAFPLKTYERILSPYMNEGSAGQEFITQPVFRVVDGKETLVVFLGAPIVSGNTLQGIAGVEISLNFMQTVADRLNLYEGSAVMTVISHDGTSVAMTGHPENTGRRIGEFESNSATTLEIVRDGEHLAWKEENRMAVYSPVAPGKSATPWSVRLTVPEDRITGFADARMKEARRGMFVMILIGIVCVLAALGILQWMSMGIARPLKRLSERLKDISDGEDDLTRRIEITSRDEVGQAATHFNTFIGRLGGIVKEIAENTNRLNSSAEELFNLSGKMASGAGNMSKRSDMLAASAEEMSANSRNVAISMEQMASAISTAATAVEQMTSTIHEIARNSEKANGVTGKAVAIARDASEKVNLLGEAAREIGQVTGVINDISEQTNLLALNATIEAARAGEAGKGFSVVANEIKELARQTTAATQEIGEKIEGIRASTQGTVSEIEEITAVVGELNSIVSNIAASIEEQSVTTREIAGNIFRTSQGIQNVNTSVAHSSDVSEEIAKDITGFSLEARGMNGNSADVNRNAESLRSLAQRLDDLLGRFSV